MKAVQDFLFTLASTVSLWRDLGVMLLAAIVIGLLWYAVEAG